MQGDWHGWDMDIGEILDRGTKLDQHMHTGTDDIAHGQINRIYFASLHTCHIPSNYIYKPD